MKWNDLKTKLHVEQVELSEDDVRNATTYLPMLHKQALVNQLVNGCIQKVELSLNDIQPIPPRYQEDSFAKSLICCAVLAGFYMHMYDLSGLLSENPSYEFSMTDYDRFASIPIQLDRIRRCGDMEIRPIASAILTDYRDFEKRLNLAIHNYINAKNDTCVRIVQMMNMQAAPDTVKNAMEQFKESKRNWSKLRKRRIRIGGNYRGKVGC